MSQKKADPVDRLPIICAAGVPHIDCETVGDVLREYPKNDFAEKIVKQKERLQKLSPGVAATPIIPEANQIRDVICPDMNKSRFLEFKDRFYENLYCKKVPLGKSTPTNSKPDELTNENTIFGKPYPKAESLYELALPKKSPDQVLKEYIRWHDKYRLSHGDFYPSEQFHRGYRKPFDPHKAYGEYINVDTSGAKVKNMIQDFDAYTKMHIISKVHEDYTSHHKSLLSEPLRRMEKTFHPDTVFGRAGTADRYHVKELLNSTVSPGEITKYANETTYRLFSTNLYCNPSDCREPAGKMLSQYPRKGNCKLLAENLGEETTVKQLISPSIPLNFGLSHRDFMAARPKEQIRRIFTNAGYASVNDDEFFEKVWAMALKEWTSLGDKVSVEAFKFALHKIENEAK